MSWRGSSGDRSIQPYIKKMVCIQNTPRLERLAVQYFTLSQQSAYIRAEASGGFRERAEQACTEYITMCARMLTDREYSGPLAVPRIRRSCLDDRANGALSIVCYNWSTLLSIWL